MEWLNGQNLVFFRWCGHVISMISKGRVEEDLEINSVGELGDMGLTVLKWKYKLLCMTVNLSEVPVMG